MFKIVCHSYHLKHIAMIQVDYGIADIVADIIMLFWQYPAIHTNYS